MAIKKFIIEVEEGTTGCDYLCPLMQYNGKCADINESVERIVPFLRCRIYNLSTMKIKEIEPDKIMKEDIINYNTDES